MPEPRAALISRRAVALGLALSTASRPTSMCAQEMVTPRPLAPTGEPLLSPVGPDADLYGATAHYPVPSVVETRLHSNPFAPRFRVGAFSHADAVYATKKIERTERTWTFRRSPERLNYRHEGRPSSVEDYLARNPVTGLLIARDDTIVCERYQYARTDHDRMLGHPSLARARLRLAGHALVAVPVGRGPPHGPHVR